MLQGGSAHKSQLQDRTLGRRFSARLEGYGNRNLHDPALTFIHVAFGNDHGPGRGNGGNHLLVALDRFKTSVLEIGLRKTLPAFFREEMARREKTAVGIVE